MVQQKNSYNHIIQSITINTDKTQAINIRARLGYEKQSSFHQAWSEVKHWQLPFTLKTYIRYDRIHFSFAKWRHDRGFDILWRLAGKDFHPFYYIFPSDYLIYRLIPELVTTTIKVVLDSQERTLLMPRFSYQEAFVAEYLSYTLESPATPRRSIIYLSEVGRLQLVTRHANYNWDLV